MMFFPPDISPDIFDNYIKMIKLEEKNRQHDALKEHIQNTPNVSLGTMMAYGMLYTEIQKSKN
jgi:hypothetical protein